MWECYNCGQKTVYWSGDFDFEDYGLDEDGIVHIFHCQNCGAEIEYYVPIGGDDE